MPKNEDIQINNRKEGIKLAEANTKEWCDADIPFNIGISTFNIMHLVFQSLELQFQLFPLQPLPFSFSFQNVHLHRQKKNGHN